MMGIRFLLATCALLALGVAGPAQAQRADERPDTVPPGNSQIDQYTESLPGPGAQEPTSGGGGGGGGGSGSGPALSPQAAGSLEALGPAGVQTAASAEATDPSSGASAPSDAQEGRKPSGSGESGALTEYAADERSPSGLPTAIDALTSSDSDGGLGIWLLALIVGVGALAVLGVLLRRRVGHAV